VNTISYKDAGVDIEAGNQLVDSIKHIAKATHQPGVLSGLGGFGALFELPMQDYKQPVLVSCTDGVGTKLRLAIDAKKHDTVGIDLVAMCANDLIVQGAKPLFFLDYYATGKLDVAVAKEVIKGIGDGCLQSSMALVGGETAEMPGMYDKADFDLAGFCVGIVDKENILDGSQVKAGDTLIALASSGPHSNGYSLIRKVLEKQDKPETIKLDGQSLIDVLLTPTRIYVKTILSLLQSHKIHGIAHITGGGLTENLPRIMPNNTQAIINTNSWKLPAVFHWLQQEGNIATEEMRRTFNCGVGMVLCVDAQQANPCVDTLNNMGEQAWILGQLETSEQSEPHVVYKD